MMKSFLTMALAASAIAIAAPALAAKHGHEFNHRVKVAPVVVEQQMAPAQMHDDGAMQHKKKGKHAKKKKHGKKHKKKKAKKKVEAAPAAAPAAAQ